MAEPDLGARGTVRPLAEIVSVEEAERAATKVREAIVQQQQQLSQLQEFLRENKALSELVLELPDAVSHSVMVPFGKAAFFPGRLIHTNEFMVLLGENHYAERSSKQTAEILGRRSEFLGKKIESVKAYIADLEAEASFINNTAEEAKAGIIEIREDYDESIEGKVTQNSRTKSTRAVSYQSIAVSSSQDVSSELDLVKSTRSLTGTPAEDPEHELLMARLSELELAESAAGHDQEDTEEEYSEEEDSDEVDNDDREHISELGSSLKKSANSQMEDIILGERYDGEDSSGEEDGSRQQDDLEEEDCNNDGSGSSEELSEDDHVSRIQTSDDNIAKAKDQSMKSKTLSRFAREAQKHGPFEEVCSKQLKSTATMDMSSGNLEEPEVMNDFQKDIEMWRRDNTNTKGHVLAERHENSMRIHSSSLHSEVQKPRETAGVQTKAFSGTVTEHGYGPPLTSHDKQVGVSQPSKPVSKFQMRQREGAITAQVQQVAESEPSRPISKFKMKHTQARR